MSEEDFEDLLPKIDINKTESFLGKQQYPQVDYTDVYANDLPKPINWTDKGYITPVKKTEEKCLGAHYAFAAADAVEAHYFK